EHFADVLGVEIDAEVAEDDLLDAGCGPQVVGPAVLRGALQQEGLQLVELVVGEGGGAADRLGVEGPREAGPGRATVRGGAGEGGRGLACTHGRDGPLAEEFAFSSSSWSSHGLFYAARA